jgi:hypothetical protein
MSTRNARQAATAATSVFAPHWSADALAAAMPRTLPPLRSFDFQPPANAAALHRPRRSDASYITQATLNTFRVRG